MQAGEHPRGRKRSPEQFAPHTHTNEQANADPQAQQISMVKKTAEQEWVETLKALADQTRLRMVRVLINGSKSVGELAESLEISPYNASKHLRVLRGVGIVEVSQSGTRRECAIAENFRKKINREPVLDLGCCVFRMAQLGK